MVVSGAATEWLIDKSALVRVGDSSDAATWADRIQRGLVVLRLLAARGQHRGPSIPDLLLAATAESAGLTILHLDKDFDLIAQLTGQPVETIARA